MTNQDIEAQNYEYQYLKFKQKRWSKSVLLGIYTIAALLPLSLPLAFWLYAQHARSVLGHYPKPYIDSDKRNLFDPMYENLIESALALSAASVVICLLTFLVLCLRRTGKPLFYSLMLLVMVWTLVFVMDAIDSTRFTTWWLD